MSELDKLENYLKEHGVFDAICHKGSWGYEEGLFEIYGTLVDEKTDGDSVVGYLTAEDVIQRIEAKK